MNYFNIDFDTIASKDGLKNKKEFFSFRLSAKQFGLNPGPYVIYPGKMCIRDRYSLIHN